MRFASVFLLVALLFSTPVFAAEKLPFPTLQFDYKNPKIPEDMLRYAVEPVFEYGENHLHKMSFAALHAPSAVWADMRYMMEEENWTVEEFNEQWNEFLDWWRRYFEITVSLYSDELWAIQGGPVGVGNFIKAIDKFVLITSNGYREEKIMPGVTPVRLLNGPTEYRSTWTFSFKRDALDSKPEWIRLYVISLESRYYFEWRFDV